jgi:amidophosphoribosyltransferase
MEKQHNRGQDGAGAAILTANPEPGEEPYWIAKSASSTPLVDVLGSIAKRPHISSHRGSETQREDDLARFKESPEPHNPIKKRCASVPLCEKIFLGHLRYATFGKNEVAFCHPFVHEASELEHTLLLAGNFNLTNAHELFEDYSRHGSFPTSKADGYLICELIAHELGKEGLQTSDFRLRRCSDVGRPMSEGRNLPIATALSKALANADGAWTLCGMTGDGWAFATRDPHGIRPGFYFISDDVVAVASERPAIQAAFDVPPEAVKELPPGQALVVSPTGETTFESLSVSKFESLTPSNPQTLKPSNFQTFKPAQRSCAFERIYFSRANDAAIHRERKALGAALVPQILEAANAPLEDIFFSYIPNSARIAFHGLLEELIKNAFLHIGDGTSDFRPQTSATDVRSPKSEVLKAFPRFGEVAVKDAKFRTFIADAAARSEFYKHVYDVTYGLVRPGLDTLVVLDDSIVRGNTMKNAILPMLDRLGPKRIVIASSAPPIRYPDCYGIDMSTLGELVAFRALVNLLDGERGSSYELRHALTLSNPQTFKPSNPLAPLYARFTEEQHCAEIARLLTPPGMKAEVKVVYQTVENLRKCLTAQTTSHEPRVTNHEPRATNHEIGDWYFTGDYPTPGGYKVLHKALENYLEQKNERSY